jgi:HEAT repeat protein
MRALEDPAWSVREVAVEELIMMGMTIEADLIPAINSPNPLLRWEAVRILGKIRSEKAMPQLIHCLKDKDWMVRAAWVLKNLK